MFLPYLVGGIVPGLIAGLACYYLSLPVIAAYQKRRRGALAAKWEALKQKRAASEKPGQEADAGHEAD